MTDITYRSKEAYYSVTYQWPKLSSVSGNHNLLINCKDLYFLTVAHDKINTLPQKICRSVNLNILKRVVTLGNILMGIF